MYHSQEYSSQDFRTCPCNHHPGTEIERFQHLQGFHVPLPGPYLSVRLLSPLWLLGPSVFYFWRWNFAQMKCKDIYSHASGFHPCWSMHQPLLFSIVVWNSLCQYTTFVLCYWWIFGWLSSQWPFWIKFLWLFLHMCFGNYFFFLESVPKSGITLVDEANQFWINYTSTCKVWELQLSYIFAST